MDRIIRRLIGTLMNPLFERGLIGGFIKADQPRWATGPPEFYELLEPGDRKLIGPGCSKLDTRYRNGQVGLETSNQQGDDAWNRTM